MTHFRLKHALAALALVGLAAPAIGEGLSAEQIARLGNDLTPLGAIRAGNEAGTIPEWTGGIRSPAEAGFPDFESGGHHPDPFADDEPLYRITAANMDEYADILSEGHKAMFRTYPDYFMDVYPTRRSAAVPERIYEATKRIAATTHLIESGNGFSGGAEGVPFPIPQNGLEAIWNHIVRYRTDSARRTIGQAPVTRDGNYTMVMFTDEYLGAYSLAGAREEDLDNVIVYFKQTVTAPARLAGEVLLVHETLNQAKENRKAWLYNPGQRRVRRAPNVAHDNPRTASDGLATSDQLDIFNGSPERYNWELVGRKEILIPYNSYKLHSNKLKYDDILKPLHINQEHARYELHRVWVVDATVKEGTRHVDQARGDGAARGVDHPVGRGRLDEPGDHAVLDQQAVAVGERCVEVAGQKPADVADKCAPRLRRVFRCVSHLVPYRCLRSARPRPS